MATYGAVRTDEDLYYQEVACNATFATLTATNGVPVYSPNLNYSMPFAGTLVLDVQLGVDWAGSAAMGTDIVGSPAYSGGFFNSITRSRDQVRIAPRWVVIWRGLSNGTVINVQIKMGTNSNPVNWSSIYGSWRATKV